MFDEKQLDALKELCNIGSGSAATVLSSFLRRDIRIAVPRVLAGKEAADLIRGGNDWVLISHDIGGPIGGRLVVAVRRPDVVRILNALLATVPAEWTQDENAISAIREVSNILTSYFLSVLGQFFKQVLVPGVPELSLDSAETALADLHSTEGLLIETSFQEKGGDTVWYLFVLPEPGRMHSALNQLLRRGV